MKTKLLVIGGLLLAVAGAAQAAGDPVVGERKATTCLGCHGVEGYRNAYPSYHVPKLAGQHAKYIVAALTAYANGNRQHPTMQAQGSALSEQDILDIAAYFEQVGR